MSLTLFDLRDRYWGRIKLRSGLPEAVCDSVVEGERQFYRLLLDRTISEQTASGIDLVCDVGARNWSYARALAEKFPNAELLGIEIDGGRRYWNLYRRRDLALAYAEELKREGRRARCLFKDFREATALDVQTSHKATPANLLFTFFFPFVSTEPCLKWGLPRRYARFDELVRHAIGLTNALPLRASSPLRIVSAHQGEWEAEIALGAYQRNLITPKQLRISSSEFSTFWPGAHDIYLLTS